jgi:DNA-binding NtrC family response regulator
MLSDKAILIVEDNVYTALDLSQAVEESNGRVIGPVGTVAEALALLDCEPVAAALLDFQLTDCDVTPVVMVLAARGVPFVVHAASGVPAEIANLHPDAPLLVKPLHADAILASLLDEMKRFERADGED